MTTISLFSSINYDRQKSFGEGTLSLLSNYFYLGGMQVTVAKNNEIRQKDGEVKWYIIALKVASFALCFPLTAPLFIANLALRYLYKHYFQPVSMYLTNPSIKAEHLTILGFGMNKPIMIYLFKRDLQNRPLYHLQELCQAIKANAEKFKDPRTMISYLEGNLTSKFNVDLVGEASDTGGVSRDYLHELTEGVMTYISPFLTGTSPFYLPSTDHLPISFEKHFENMGILMMYCYHSERQVQTPTETLFISRFIKPSFDPALFSAILRLTAEEIDGSELNFNTKIKICHALVQSRIDAGENLSWLSKLLTNIMKTPLQLDSKKKVDQFVESFGVDQNRLSCAFIGKSAEIDVSAVQNNQEKFVEEVVYLCISQSTQIEVSKIFKPIQAIARGMKEICHPGKQHSLTEKNDHWNQFFCNPDNHEDFWGPNYQSFSDKVQGSRLTPESRQSIADNILYDDSNEKISKDVKRLQGWIVDKETTDEEVRIFLKFATGATIPLKDQKITVFANESYPSVVPKASTCGFTLTFSTEYPQDLAQAQLSQSEEEKTQTFISYLKQEMQRTLNEFDTM